MTTLFARMMSGTIKARTCLEQLKAKGNTSLQLPDQSDHFCFRVGIKNSSYEISVSFPPDMHCGNYETALFQHGSLVYREDWEYDDIKRFETFEELYAEILDICEKIHPEQVYNP